VSRGAALRWLQAGVTLALVTVLAWFIDWPQVLRALRSVQLLPATVVVALVLVERLVLNVKWHALLREGQVVLGYWRLFRIQLAANALGTFLPGSLGVDALRIAGLWQFQARRAAVLAATLLDRLTTVLATVVVSGVMVVLVAGALVGSNAVHQVLAGAALFAGAIVAAFSPPGRRVLAWLLSHLPRTLHRRVVDAVDAAWLIGRSRRAVVTTVAASLGAVALRVVIGKFLLLAAGVDVPLATLAFVLPVVWGIAMLPISIGGVGVQDATYVVLLGHAGVPPPVAVVVSLLDHTLTRIPVAAGLLFWRDVVPRAAGTGGAPRDDVNAAA
jgi:glycosyltransferase 2 family protein